jgi:DNA-binding NarL/FixJ family response regulator
MSATPYRLTPMSREPQPSPETTVLICDDNSSMRTLLRIVVGLAPDLRVVGEVGDGEAAICEASRLQPDVILLDLAMPVLSGLAALPRLRRTAVGAKIIVLSGLPTATVGDHVLACGADSYLEKGTAPSRIVAAIEFLVARTGAPV